MSNEPTRLGVVKDVTGPTVSVALDEATSSGLLFVDGLPYRVGQVGSFVRIPLGFSDLIGVVSQAGSGAVPSSLASETERAYRWLTIQLLGEGTARGFSRGIGVLPSIEDPVHLVTQRDLERVYGRDDDERRITIGRVASAEGIRASLDLDALITRHVAVVGTSGSGKSTTVAALVKAITDPIRFPAARVLLFDTHGEYSRALADRATVFSVDGRALGSERLEVPYWALAFDELVPLTFGNFSDDAGRGAIRDAIVRRKRVQAENDVDLGIAPEHVTVDSPVPFSIHDLWFDLHREVNSTHTAQGLAQSAETIALELDDHGHPLEEGDAMAVVAPRYRPATQAAGAEKIYLSSSNLNVRRQVDALGSRLRDRRFDFLFRPGPWAPAEDGSTDQDLDSFLALWVGSERPVAILDLSGVPSAVIADLVGALSRVIYDALFWARRLGEGGRERPLLMVFEEAHSYLRPGASSSVALASVQRIVKEGRKYGVGAMVVSQRPSEIDSTILSQCGTTIALRLANDTDRGHVLGAVSDNLSGLLAMLPVLRTGEAIVVGEAVPLAMRVLVTPPDPLPDSTDPKVVAVHTADEVSQPGGWNRDLEEGDYHEVVVRWRTNDPRSSRTIPT